MAGKSGLAVGVIEMLKEDHEKVKGLFATDHTHTSPAGAELNASLVVAGLQLLSRKPLNRYLSERGKAVQTERPK